jgi:hypothetical protein
MSGDEHLRKTLLQLLAGMDFAERYYGYFERTRGRGAMPSYSREDLAAALAATGLEFRYHSKERFFSYREEGKTCTVGLNAAFPDSKVELILTLDTADGDIGGTFAELAADVRQARDPGFEYSPPYPKLPFSNATELGEAVQLGVSLFKDAKHAILAHDAWGSPP